MVPPDVTLLGPALIRQIAEELGVRPTKTWGQNFVHDGGTVRKIVRAASIRPGEHVIEVGPGLGSLTLGLLEAGAWVTAIEIDPVLAGRLPLTVAQQAPAASGLLTVIPADAMTVREVEGPPPTALVANLPYNVAVPLLLTFLERFDSLERVLVMVQAEVADRLAAAPGSRVYGVPSVKAQWYGTAHRAASVGRAVFWPMPNVDSALVALTRHAEPRTSASRGQVFAVVDAAFAQRRKTLRRALTAGIAVPAIVDEALAASGTDGGVRGEQLAIGDFVRLTESLLAAGAEIRDSRGGLAEGMSAGGAQPAISGVQPPAGAEE